MFTHLELRYEMACWNTNSLFTVSANMKIVGGMPPRIIKFASEAMLGSKIEVLRIRMVYSDKNQHKKNESMTSVLNLN